jgi:hypothetical protein
LLRISLIAVAIVSSADTHILDLGARMEWVGLLCWQLALAILPASAWLIVCRLIPGLRRRVGVSYCVAAGLIAMSCIFTRNGFTFIGLLAVVIASVILCVRWRQALKHRSLEVNTIISYEDLGQ